MKQMQPTGHDKSQYDRVTNKWRCGGSAEGPPCAEGPDGRGHCPYAQADRLPRRLCEPVSKGGAWECGLSELDGGPCVQGPGADGRCCEVLPPCTPVLTERRRRRKWVLLLLIVTIGVFGLLSSGAMLTWLISPGPTDHRHAMIEQCETCHANLVNEFSTLLLAGIEGFQGDHHQAVSACVNCHKIAEYPEQVHNAAPEVLADISRRLAEQPAPLETRISELSCASCHEIHNDNVHASSLTDQQCQSCHIAQFESFQHGHPAFSGLPEVTPQIVFDHRRHQELHFEKKAMVEFAPQQCTDCHLPNDGTDLKLAGFDSMCSDCHLEKDVTNKLIDKIGPTTVFAVPNINAEEVSIGFWPNCRTTQFKRISNMPVLMRRLLETDPDAVAAMELLTEDNTAMNSLDDVAPEVLEAVVALSKAVRTLAADMAAEDALERFSVDSETRQISNDELTRLVGAIPVDVRRLLYSSWFADQPVEEAGGQVCSSRDEWRAMRDGIEKDKDEIRSNPGWYLQAKSSYMALSYVPQLHADPLMRLFSDLADHDPQWYDDRLGFQCSKCHLTATGGAEPQVAWPVVENTRRTQFSHATHLVTGEVCATCHALTDVGDEEDFAAIDHHPIEKAQCDSCHRDGAVEQSCSDCHTYHWQPMRIEQTAAPSLLVEPVEESAADSSAE